MSTTPVSSFRTARRGRGHVSRQDRDQAARAVPMTSRCSTGDMYAKGADDMIETTKGGPPILGKFVALLLAAAFLSPAASPPGTGQHERTLRGRSFSMFNFRQGASTRL